MSFEFPRPGLPIAESGTSPMHRSWVQWLRDFAVRFFAHDHGAAGGETVDHGDTDGRSDDDHTQYALLAGRAGGQSLIGGTASGNSLTLRSSSNATKGKVILGAAGTTAYDEVNERLGIGTASPTAPLEVSSDYNTEAAGSPSIIISGAANKERIEIKSLGATPGASFQGVGAGGTIASPTRTVNGTSIMGLGGGGYDNAGTPAIARNKALITMNAEEDWSTTAQGCSIRFFTTAATTTTRAEKMRIASDGKVGIGTASPSYALDVVGDIRETGNIIVPKTSGVGIKVDTTTPTFGWADLLGSIDVRGTAGATTPTHATYRGGLKEFQFSVNDECYLEFHIPHDYLPGSDIHIHAHWSHIATTVTGGSVTWGFEVSYAKGHNQAAFSAPVTPTILQNASTTQYQHMIAEVQLSAASPSASQIDTDNLEVDGLILVRAYLSANAMTVSGGGVPEPFLHFVDVHYQTTNIGTKNKAPGFYT